ncbi:MAG: 23S rRNA (guanosine(2251)-2'-O)-methyltransferase RlmB [Tannerella sp.]|jgi:23S rRNA (guanosine2251-2'-O)-methyltransferase|nr:23S rRNA (guanosine(2251)-2'-O)-methyltransferase RlmB [Tannerella sp.]
MKENEIVFGIRAVIEAAKAGKTIDKLLIKRDSSGDILKELFAVVKEYQIPVQRVPLERLNRITLKNHQGVIAFISAVTYYRLEDVIPAVFEQGKDPFVVLLDGITDVRNFGAIARTCECAGVHAIVIPSRESVMVNADSMKTSAGALNVIPVCKEKTINQSIRFLKDCGLTVIAASEKGSKVYTEASFTGPLAIVMGAEDTGIAPENLRICNEIVKIPLFGTVGSLNVSVAASILVYEGVRQRERVTRKTKP